jgi:hypothetical protein
MNRGLIITLIVIALAVGGGVYGYRNHKQTTQREMQERRAAFDKAEAARRAEDARKNEEAQAEARRLAEAKSAAESDASTKELERLRVEQADAEARRVAAEEEANQAIKARERLALEKQKADAEARVELERRVKAAGETEAARLAALQEISRLEQEKKAAADREAARLAALQRQQELEASEAQKIPVISRSILPSDYKRREHYYLDVEMQNAENAKPPTRPKPAGQGATP